MSPYLQTDKCWPWTTLLADVTRGSLLPEALQWEIRMEWTGQCRSAPGGEEKKEHWLGRQGGLCNETEDVRVQDGRGKAVAGDCWGWATPRDGSYGSSSWTLSMSVLLAYCLLRGFMRPRSKSKGRRASQQKCPINKALRPPGELQQGRGAHLPPLPASEP